MGNAICEHFTSSEYLQVPPPSLWCSTFILELYGYFGRVGISFELLRHHIGIRFVDNKALQVCAH